MLNKGKVSTMSRNVDATGEMPKEDVAFPGESDWAHEVRIKAAQDNRQQPWKNVFGSDMNANLDKVNDLTSIMPTPTTPDGRPLPPLRRVPSNGLSG